MFDLFLPDGFKLVSKCHLLRWEDLTPACQRRIKRDYGPRLGSDLARRLAVTPGLVSRVKNGQKSSRRIAEAISQELLAIARELSEVRSAHRQIHKRKTRPAAATPAPAITGEVSQ